MMPTGPRDTATNPSIFLRMNATDPGPRELAWEDFSTRYAPIISEFARRLGGKPQDVEDIVQDVMLGFFLRSPKFVYDPSKGRFRSYLKVCTDRALRHRLGREARLHGRPLDEIDPGSVAIDQVWSDVWEQQLLCRAVDELRLSIGQTKTFMAFERYIVFEEPADEVAATLGIHLNTVYRAKEQITRALRDKVAALREED